MGAIEIVYIGDDFYRKSGTAMSSLYRVTASKWERWDYGMVQSALTEGRTLLIRQATDAEYGRACRMLKKFEK